VAGGLVWWLFLRPLADPPDLVYDEHPLSYWVRDNWAVYNKVSDFPPQIS
jgi:hypothetical protein